MTSYNNSLLNSLLSHIAQANPMQARPLEDVIFSLHKEEKDELEDYLNFCKFDGISIENLTKAYLTITMDTLREQVYFQRHGRYRYTSFKEVAEKVYFDPNYMAHYMHGLALTLFLWPNHLEILRFFRKAQLQKQGNLYLEVGPGHGIFFREAARNRRFKSYIGVDISPTSLEMTRKLLSSDRSLHGVGWTLLNADFLATDALQGRFDAVVMGEVLEHVEEPLLFLIRIRELVNNGAFIFVTTAVNAPAIDHIYLFRTIDEVCDLVIAAGLSIEKILATPYKGCTMQETIQQKLPINVAMVLAA
jgi:2-polyprenyl-3-methyl-5-hydroxy-6-metoxy-1,4-benzoquinol methylase